LNSSILINKSLYIVKPIGWVMKEELHKIRRQNAITTFIGMVTSLIAAGIGLYFGTGESVIGIVILLGIFGFIVLFFLISWPINILLGKFRKIESNEAKVVKLWKDLNKLKDNLEINKKLAELEVRISSFEKKNKRKMDKKGVFDPRWIIIIVILILLYLFLKQQGLMG